MAVTINTFYSTKVIQGATPSNPSFPADQTPPPVLNPPGSTIAHDPVTIGSPANGLSLIGQELSIGIASSGVTGALSGTDWDKFNSFSLSDGLVIIGGAVQTGNDITYDTVWQVRISDVLYSPLVSTLISFPVTSSGFTRIDLTVLDNSGVISRVAGTEVAVGSPVTAPSVPANSVALQEVTIIDTGISAVTNFALSSFVRFDINNQGLNGTQRSNARTNIGAIGGTIASGQVAFGTGAGTIGGGNVLTWNEGRLNIVSAGFPSLTTYRDADVLSVGTAAQFFEMGARKGSVFTSAIRVSGVLLSDGNNGYLAASVLSGGSLVEYLRLIANGNLLIGTPTDSGNKLRVNGTVRIDTISNLGTTATVLLTKSATGVISERTVAEVSTDLGAVLTTGNQNISGIKTFEQIVLPTISNNSNLKVGSLEFQSFELNNSWFGDNLFFNGTAFQRRATGYAGLFYFAPSGEGQFRFYDTGAAGSTITGFNVQFKIDRLGVTVCGGTAISNAAGVYTGATFRADSNGVSIGLNGSAPTARLDVRGIGTTTGLSMILEDSAGTNNVEFLDNGQIRFLRLPTSSAGLAAGSLWNNGGVLNIV